MAGFLAECLDDESRFNRVLPIGGPGEAITPKQQGEQLFALLGRKPRFKHVPLALLDSIVFVLSTLGRVVPTLAEKAELARIGRYYASESMLVLDPATGRYDAAATPSTGTETLFDFYARLDQGRGFDRARRPRRILMTDLILSLSKDVPVSGDVGALWSILRQAQDEARRGGLRAIVFHPGAYIGNVTPSDHARISPNPTPTATGELVRRPTQRPMKPKTMKNRTMTGMMITRKNSR